MLFRFRPKIPETLDTTRLENYYQSLELNGPVIIWDLEADDENLLGFVHEFSPMVIQVKETLIAERLEGRIAHEITHIYLTNNGYRNLDYHDEPISNENNYNECIHIFSNFLHHQILYKKIINFGFTLDDDIEIVQRYYTDANINNMSQAYRSPDRFAKAWVVISIMNDLIRLSEHSEVLTNILTHHIPEAINEARELLQAIGEVNTIEEYENSKRIIEQRLNLPTYSFITEEQHGN